MGEETHYLCCVFSQILPNLHDLHLEHPFISLQIINFSEIILLPFCFQLLSESRFSEDVLERKVPICHWYFPRAFSWRFSSEKSPTITGASF